MKQTFAILCGCGRSGTTMLRMALDKHSQICATRSWIMSWKEIPVRDVPLFTYLIHYCSHFYSLPIDTVLSIYEDSGNLDVFCKNLLFHHATLYKKRTVIDASNTYMHRIEEIRKHIPGTKVIHLIRDPRDVVLSKHPRRSKGVKDGKAYIPLSRWIDCIEAGKRYKGKDWYLEVQYEEIIRKPKEEISKILNFLGEEWEDKMLEFHLNPSAHCTPDKDLDIPTNGYNFPFHQNSIGKWKLNEDLPEIREIRNNQKCLRLMKKLGYVFDVP